MKTCSQCGETKPLAEFAHRKASKDGYCAHCKACHMRYHWRRRDQNVQRMRTAYAEHHDTIRAQQKTYYWKDPEARRSEALRYYRTHRDEHHARTQAYYEAHKAVICRQTLAYRKTEKGKKVRQVIDSHRRAAGKLSAADWEEILDRYGHRCLACGATGIPLSIDHIIPIVKGGKTTKDNVQPLCIQCNRDKGKRIIDYRPR